MLAWEDELLPFGGFRKGVRILPLSFLLGLKKIVCGVRQMVKKSGMVGTSNFL